MSATLTGTPSVAPDPRKGATSASNAAADAACGGRHLAQAGLTKAKSDDAIAGSTIHAALATGNTSKLSRAETETHDACKAIALKLVVEFFGAGVTPTVFAEQRFWGAFGPKGKEFPHSGQADVVFRHGVKALILDYKSLAGEVAENPKNLQLRDLAVLVWGNLPPISEVGVAIVQPLVTHSPDICVYGDADLKRSEQEMGARITASNNPQSPRSAGELQCKFCLAKTKCASYSAWTGSLLPVKAAEDALIIQTAFQIAMAEWGPEQRASVAAVLSPAGKALEEIKDFLKEGLAKDAAFVPGWELKPGAKRETIVDAQVCFDRTVALMPGATPEEKTKAFMGCVAVAKGKLKDQVHAGSGEKGKALDATMARLLEGIVESSQNSPSLKKKGDA